MPLAGIQQPGSEGAYLIVNKTLIECIAVCVLLAFKTGEIAGLDLLLKARRRKPRAMQSPAPAVVAAATTAAPADQVVFQSKGD